MNSRWLIKDKMTLISHWLPTDYSSITSFPPASANNMEKYPFFIEMMFTCKWSYNVGELSPLRHMQTKRCPQQIPPFHFWLYVFINFLMITNQLNDNKIARKMLSLMRIKKLNGVIFPEVAVYLQRKTAWTLEYCRHKQLQYITALQLALSLSCS